MAVSLFSPQQITFTQKDFYFTFAIPYSTPVCRGLCRPLPNKEDLDRKWCRIEYLYIEYSQAVEFGPLLRTSLQLYLHMTGPLEPRKV
jgi:hypothetical protein